MNIYLIERSDIVNYDEYDSAIVISKSEEKAKYIHPNANNSTPEWWKDEWHSWTSDPKSLKVRLIGIAQPEFKEGEVICASYNAG